MQKHSSAKTRYASFAVTAALGLGILGPALIYVGQQASAEDAPAVVETVETEEPSAAAAPAAAATSEHDAEASASPVQPGEAASPEEGTAPEGDIASPAGPASPVASSTEPGATTNEISTDGVNASAAGSPAATTAAADGSRSAAAGTSREGEEGPEEAAELTVTITDKTLGTSVEIKVASGGTIGEQYNPDWTSKYIDYGHYSKNAIYKLMPSKFKDTKTEQVLTLKQLKAQPISEASTFEVVNYTRSVPFTWYYFDGRGTDGSVTLDDLVVYNKATNEVALTQPLTLTWSTVSATDTSGYAASTQIGKAQATLLLDHLNDDGTVAEYTDGNKFVFPYDGMQNHHYWTGASTYRTGGVEIFKDCMPRYYTIWVSDATSEHPVDTNVDITYTTWGQRGSDAGKKMVYTRTNPFTVKYNSGVSTATFVSVYGNTYTYNLSVDGAEALPDQTLNRLDLTAASGYSYRDNGEHNVWGVSTLSLVPQDMEGYVKEVTGDGLTTDTIFRVRYYRQVNVSFDLNGGTGTVDPFTALQTKPLSDYISELPTPTAPENYDFVGWTLNGKPVNVNYVVEGGSDITLVAQYQKREYTVGITDRYFGNTELKVDPNTSIGTAYNPIYQGHKIGWYTYKLLPSKFKAADGTVYTLEELQQLPIAANSTFEVVNYTRKVPMTFYTWDGRPESTDFALNDLVIRTGSKLDEGETVLEMALPPLNYYEVSAQDASGSKESSRFGWTSTTVYLEHLDAEGNLAAYNGGPRVFPYSATTDSITTNNLALAEGGNYNLRDLINPNFRVFVSDATAEKPVETNVDVVYGTFAQSGDGVEKLTYSRTATTTVDNAEGTTGRWVDSSTSDFTRTTASGESTEGAKIDLPYLTVADNDPQGNGLHKVLGVSTISYTPRAMEGYRAFVEGDGLSRSSLATISYYREVTLTFNYGDGTGDVETLTGLHTKPLKEVLESLPTPTAPAGYSFGGWTINGQPVDLDYVPETTDGLTLVATYVKDKEDEVPATPVTPADSSSDASDSSDASYSADKKPQKSESKKQIAKTGDATSMLPSVFGAVAGGGTLVAGAAAAALARLRKRDQD